MLGSILLEGSLQDAPDKSFTRLRLRHRAQHLYFGWWLVGGAIGIQVLHVALFTQAYGLYVSVLRDEFAWSTTALAAGFSLKQAVTGSLGPVQGWLLQRFGPRNIMRLGTVIFGLGFMLLSQVSTLSSFFLVLFFMAIGSSLGGFLSLTTAIVNWFERRRSSALALVQTGMSLGGLAVPAVAWALSAYGWRSTALVSGLLILLLGLPLTQLMRSRPEDYGLLPDGRAAREQEQADASQAASENGRDFGLREAMRTRGFWLLNIGHGLALLVVSSVTVHLVVHLNEGLGYSLQLAATVVAVMTASTMLGQLLGGFLGDRVDKRFLASAGMIAHATALLFLAYASSLLMALTFALLHGLAWGLRGPLMQAMRADYFGRKAFATIMGVSFFFAMFGMIGGPILTGYLADSLGSYTFGLTLLAGLALSGSAVFLLATRPPKPVS